MSCGRTESFNVCFIAYNGSVLFRKDFCVHVGRAQI